ATALPLLSESRVLADRPQLAASLQKLVQALGTSLEHKLVDVAAGRLPAAEATHDLRALVAQALSLVESQIATTVPDPTLVPNPTVGRGTTDPALAQLRASLQGLGDHLARQFIEIRTPDLRAGLTDLGYAVDDVRCLPASRPPARSDAGTPALADAATRVEPRILRVDARA